MISEVWRVECVDLELAVVGRGRAGETVTCQQPVETGPSLVTMLLFCACCALIYMYKIMTGLSLCQAGCSTEGDADMSQLNNTTQNM